MIGVVKISDIFLVDLFVLFPERAVDSDVEENGLAAVFDMLRQRPFDIAVFVALREQINRWLCQAVRVE